MYFLTAVYEQNLLSQKIAIVEDYRMFEFCVLLLNVFNRNNLLRFNVSTRTLQKLSLPIANNNCSTQYIVGKKFDFNTQFCAGGELRKYFL